MKYQKALGDPATKSGGNNMNAIYMLDGNNIKTIGGVTIARTDKSTIIPSIKDVNGNILVRIHSNSKCSS